MEKQIGHLKGHTIVCGYGRNGKQAILKLSNYNRKFVVVERSKEKIEALDVAGILNIEGDATLDETLQRAGIENAAFLITALPSDADNLFVVLTASQLNKDCIIISRAGNESSYKKLKFAGANNVIMSLFKVNDQATQELMNTFYEEWIKTGDKKKSFIKAKNHIRSKYDEPINWGSFIMIGLD